MHGTHGRHTRRARFGLLPRTLITAVALAPVAVTLCAAPFILLRAVWRTADAALRGDLWRRPPPYAPGPPAWTPDSGRPPPKTGRWLADEGQLAQVEAWYDEHAS